MEQVALDTLEDDATKDDLLAALQTTQIADVSPVAPVSTGMISGSPTEAQLAAQMLDRIAPDTAIWTTAAPQDHRLITTRALPSDVEFLAMFDMGSTYWQTRAQSVAV